MQLGWVDFSREDREKVLDVMNLLQEPGAVDEIGIGVVRDAFANLFFPGTSTVQTAAKYFFIVPYILKEAADGKYGSDLRKILQRIDDEEKQCGIRLMQNCPGRKDIIGRRVLPQKWVARRPSSIYWNGIRTYGICTQDISIPELMKASVLLQSQKKQVSLGNKGDDSADSERDDADAGRDLTAQFFAVPDDYYGDWRTGLVIDLTTTEAAFLRKMIETSIPGSLLGYLLKNNIDVAKYASFEAMCEDVGAAVPADLSRLMKLACEFNRLVYAAHVRYNDILFNGQNDAAVEEWAYIEENMQYMMAVDIDEAGDHGGSFQVDGIGGDIFGQNRAEFAVHYFKSAFMERKVVTKDSGIFIEHINNLPRLFFFIITQLARISVIRSHYIRPFVRQ